MTLTVRQHAALVALERAGEMTSPELADALQISRLEARRVLLSLVELGHARARRTRTARVSYRPGG